MICVMDYELWQFVSTENVETTLNLEKTSSQLPGVDIHFQLRLRVSPERGWSWDITTIKTHLPTYKGELPHLFALLTQSILSCSFSDSSLDFVQVGLKLRTQGFLSLTWYIVVAIQSTFAYVQCIIHSSEFNQLPTLLLSSTDWGANGGC